MTAFVDTLFLVTAGASGVTPVNCSPLVLPTVAFADVADINAFYRTRAPLRFTLGRRAATMVASWPPAADKDVGKIRVEVAVAGAPAAVTVSRAVIERLVGDLDADQNLEGVEAGHLALIVECALGPALTALEEALGASLAVIAVAAETGPREDTPLSFTLAVEGLADSWGELRLPYGHARRLVHCLDRAVPAVVPVIDVPVAACVRVGVATCPIGEVATLVPGDVVVTDHAAEPGTAIVVAGEHLAAAARLTAAGAELAAPLSRVQGSLWEWSMENGADRPQAEEHSDFNDIPLKLVFELGRIELPLRELRGLAPGAVIPLPKTIEDSVDIAANGRRIGRGTLVQIGNSLGVRITRLFHHG